LEKSLKSEWVIFGNTPSETLEFITELIQYLSEGEDQAADLPSILAFVGQYLDAGRVTMSFDGQGGTQEYSWINHRMMDKGSWETYQYQLKKSGPNSRIKFSMQGGSQDFEALLVLIATLIDASLAFNQTIRLQHSQWQLAESINQISKILTSTLDHDELLSLFLDQLEILVPYDSANVMLLHDGLLYMHAARGYENFSGPMDIAQISFVPSETFLVEEVLQGTQPVILADTKKCPEWMWAPCGEHVRSWMAVPLRVKGNAIGLFSIDKSTPNFFNEKHAQLASALAKHAALALDNALLFTQVQEAHEQLRGFSAKIIEVQEKERQKIAMELHDHTGQALLALRAELRVLRHHLSSQPEQAEREINYLDQIVLELSKDLSQLAYDLRPPTLTALGLASALEQYITDFSRRMNVRADFVHDIVLNRLPEDIELVCYRIVQEALTNLVKHAQADHVEITLNYKDNLLHLVVKDNGIGFTNLKPRGRRGFGLLGIRERLSQINGSLKINSQPGKGTELIVSIPVAG